MRGAKKHRTGSLQQEVPHILPAGDIAAQCANTFGKRANLQSYTTIKPKMIESTTPILAKHTTRMSIVYHHNCTVFFREAHALTYRRYMPIQANDPI